MKIRSGTGKEITTTSDWEEWFKSKRDPTHSKEGRSACSLADFIINRDGASHLKSVLLTVLGTHVLLDTATPELEAKFDSYRNPAQLDLGIWGHTAEGKSLFVGVEAKVDDPFGDKTVEAYYWPSVIDRNKGKGTGVPERIRGLVSLYAPGPVDEALRDIGPVRYQLLTGTAGTVAAGKEVSVFLVLVFRTFLYDEAKGADIARTTRSSSNGCTASPSPIFPAESLPTNWRWGAGDLHLRGHPRALTRTGKYAEPGSVEASSRMPLSKGRSWSLWLCPERVWEEMWENTKQRLVVGLI